MRPASQKSPKRVRKSGFRLFWRSFKTLGRTLSALLEPCPGVLFRESFWTLPGFRARRARETLCGRGRSQILWSFRPPRYECNSFGAQGASKGLAVVHLAYCFICSSPWAAIMATKSTHEIPAQQSSGESFRVARLQNQVGAKDFFSRLKTRTAIYRIPKKSQKSLPGPPGLECPKSLEKSQKGSKSVKRAFSETFLRRFDSFRDFLDTPGSEARGDSFESFWGFRAPSEGPETPVNGRSVLNSRREFSHEKCSEIFPDFFEPFLWVRKIPQNSHQISCDISMQKI